ncbi:MAG: protein kinase domain-containing protein [Nannocystales bacterium]
MAIDVHAPSEACPDEGQISAYVSGGLEPELHAAIEAHLDGCDACSQLVAELVRIFADARSSRSVLSSGMLSSGSLTRTEGGAPEPHDGPELLAPGSAIGRYRTLECVGIGGMGVVYAAYDPHLDRRVALKLLLDVGGDNGARKRARLLREAQSMAKLTHTNVITVHDVGTWHGQVFVAMEFVEGGTLKSWMREKRRSWKEIRVTMLAAGRGLAAAHAVGLVHRDFKPDNVLLGDDGRVRVTDFGLARWEDGAVSTGEHLLSGSADVSGSLDEPGDDVLSAEVSLTRTGALVGTPAYMAPELYAHEVADAATDQFAFCVALYEALYGERPFHGQTLAELATNVVSADGVEFPGAVSVPRHIRKALRRGLSRRRHDRFPSMDALMAALDRRVVRRWRQAAVIGVPMATLALGAWGTSNRDTQENGCGDASAVFGVVWSEERRARISEAFSRADSALAGQASRALLESVDAYAESWGAAAQSTCEARSREGGRTFVVLAERCLAQRRIALDIALEDFEEVDDGDIGRARGLVASIARDCTDEGALLSGAPPPAPEDLREEVERVRLELAKVDGYLASGEYQAGVELARKLDTEAAITGHEPLQAETRLELARILDLAGDVEGAAAALEEAELLGMSSRFHRVTAQALTLAVYVRGVIMQQHDVARGLALRAAAATKAAGGDDQFRAALLMNQASLEYSAGEYATAESFAARALKLRDREADAMRWADAAYNLATIRMFAGRNAEAIDTLHEYISTFEAEVGHFHPDVSVGYHTLSMALLATGKTDEGEEALRTALEILEKTVGESHPLYANPLSDLSVFEAERGNLDVAISLARKALAIREEQGAQPLSAAANRLHVAQWLAELHRVEEARTELDRAEKDALAAVGPGHPRMAEFHVVRASLHANDGNREATKEAMDRAQVLIEADPEALWNHRLIWARQLGILGADDEAMAELRTLLAQGSQTQPQDDLAQARFVLAGFVEAKTPGAAEARVLAQTALRGFEKTSKTAAAEEVRGWLAEH